MSSAMAPMVAGDIDRDQAFAPLGGERGEFLDQRAILAINAGFFGDAEESLHARVAFGVGAMADAGHALLSFVIILDDRRGDGIEIGILRILPAALR